MYEMLNASGGIEMSEMIVANKVEQIEGFNADNIPDEIFCSDKPVLIKQAVRDWPLVKAGMQSVASAIDILRQHYSGHPAPVYFADAETKGYLAYNQDVSALNFKSQKADLAVVLNELLEFSEIPNPPVRYIPSNIADVFFPGLRAAHEINFNKQCFVNAPLSNANLLYGIWIGNRTTAPCHYDAQSNMACCVAGQRRFTLFPPEQIHNLYPGPLDLTPGGPAISMVDFRNPDFDRYPRFAEAVKAGLVAEMEPGDVLYIPCMWWHHVESLAPFNILIQYWWNTFPKVQGQAINAFELALLSIRDRPMQEKMAWKHIFDYYIFGDSNIPREHIPNSAWGTLGTIDDALARQMRTKIINKLNR